LTTKLRLLLDECLQGPLAEEIAKFSSLNVEWITNTLLGNCGFADENVVAYARQERRIVVTAESRLNERKFIICTHPGILVFKATKRHEAIKAQMFSTLIKSGIRVKCKHAVTYLKLDETGTRTIAHFKEKDERNVIQETIVDLTHNKILKSTRDGDFPRSPCAY
jgi:predicted nuclease of predicted toxin-antitoxin system